jgi:hypothetical protein
LPAYSCGSGGTDAGPRCVNCYLVEGESITLLAELPGGEWELPPEENRRSSRVRRQSRAPRKPSIATLVKRAEKTLDA